MNASAIARVLWQRRILRQRERWTPTQRRAYQDRELARLRAFAAQQSRFYQRFHAGLAAAPLDDLPVLTKKMLMDNFDEVATDPAVRLSDIQAYLDTLPGDGRFAGRYWVSATSGSSGRKGIIPSDVHEWAMVIASYGRANEWAGISAGPLHPVSTWRWSAPPPPGISPPAWPPPTLVSAGCRFG